MPRPSMPGTKPRSAGTSPPTAAAPVLDAGRAAMGALTGLSGGDVVYTTGANDALDILLSSWPGERTVACLPGEYGPNLAIMAANGFTCARCRSTLTADSTSTPRPARWRPTLPRWCTSRHWAATEASRSPWRRWPCVPRSGLPLVVDAAQALGHLDCAVTASAMYRSSRKWLAGPRGVGFLAVHPDLAQRLRPRLPRRGGDSRLTVMQRIEQGEANVAARVGYSVALGEHLAAGPKQVGERLADVGRTTR